MRAFINVIWNNVPFLMSLACFATYIVMDPNNELTATKAFVSLTYINLMKLPMMFIPFLIVGAIQVWVAIQRLNRYLNSEELDDAAVNRDADNRDHPGMTFELLQQSLNILGDKMPCTLRLCTLFYESSPKLALAAGQKAAWLVHCLNSKKTVYEVSVT